MFHRHHQRWSEHSSLEVWQWRSSPAALSCWILTHNGNEKALRETQTLHTGCSKAEPKNFAPPQTLFPGARDGQKLISWRRSLLYLQTQFGEDGCTQFRVIVVTDPHPHTNKQTHRQDLLQYTAPLSLARSEIINWRSAVKCMDILKKQKLL